MISPRRDASLLGAALLAAGCSPPPPIVARAPLAVVPAASAAPLPAVPAGSVAAGSAGVALPEAGAARDERMKRTEELLKHDCLAGDEATRGPACAALAREYELGVRVARDDARAVEAYQRACLFTELGACLDLVLGVPPAAPRDAAALALFTRSCGAGIAHGCVVLGMMHEAGRGAPRDLALAAVAFKKACDAGDANGCTWLGRIAGDKALKGAYGRSTALFKRACEADDAEGCEAYSETPGLGDAEVFRAVVRACGGGGGAPHACWRISYDKTLVPPRD